MFITEKKKKEIEHTIRALRRIWHDAKRRYGVHAPTTKKVRRNIRDLEDILEDATIVEENE